MSEETPRYLKANVRVEPLFNQWYAWTQLLQPATAAMQLTFRHLKMLESYVAAPQSHAQAVKDPRLLGGPFIDHQGKRVDEVRDLMERTRQKQAPMIAFAEAVKQFDAVLQTEADGTSLEPLYAKVPDVLKGYVELVYDLNNHASMVFCEPLLYASPLYDEGLQSVTLSCIEGDERPFALTTPRLPMPDEVAVRRPFSDAALDQLFAMKRKPGSVEEMRQKLGVPDDKADLFSTFFTTTPPRLRQSPEPGQIRLRYFGHACLLFETDEVSILTDPVISYDIPNSIPRYTFLDLPDTIDYLLITHAHLDHFTPESLMQVRHHVRQVVVPRNNAGALYDPSLKLMLKHLGFKNVIEVDPLDVLPVSGGKITALPFNGEHGDLNVRSKTGYLVELQGRTALCAADATNIEPQLYRRVHPLVGDIDLLFMGMECDGAPVSWGYGALMTRPLPRAVDRSRCLSGSDCPQAMALVDEFHCQRVYIYAMGQEPWLNYVMAKKYAPGDKPIVESNKLLDECNRRGIQTERLFGQWELQLPPRVLAGA